MIIRFLHYVYVHTYCIHKYLSLYGWFSYLLFVTYIYFLFTRIAANNRKLENKKILLLEGSSEHKYTPNERYSNRVVALNQQTRTLLSSIGAWKHIEAVRYTPVRKMQVMKE